MRCVLYASVLLCIPVMRTRKKVYLLISATPLSIEYRQIGEVPAGRSHLATVPAVQQAIPAEQGGDRAWCPHLLSSLQPVIRGYLSFR